MAATTTTDTPDTGGRYGAFAYASVVLTCFAVYFFDQRFYWSERMVPVVFGLGAVYTALGMLDYCLTERGPRALALYFVIQCVLLTALLWLSPVRGFFGIIVLPVAAQAVFDLKRRWAFAIAAYLYALNISLWAVPFGWRAGLEALLNFAAAFAFTLTFSFITKRALDFQQREEKLRRELEVANAQLREFAAQAGDLATTRERNRLAREIHDGLGHYLTVVKTQLDAAHALLPAQPDQARETVGKAAHLTAEALDDVRRSVGALRTDAARPPLPEALRALTREAGLPVAVHIAGTARPLAPGIEHALYRSAQEGLTNIRKHAGAASAEITLDFSAPDRVALAVTDDGRGTRQSPAATAGFGLRGIRERIEVLGGRCTAGNRAAGGFALTLEVPA